MPFERYQTEHDDKETNLNALIDIVKNSPSCIYENTFQPKTFGRGAYLQKFFEICSLLKIGESSLYLDRGLFFGVLWWFIYILFLFFRDYNKEKASKDQESKDFFTFKQI